MIRTVLLLSSVCGLVRSSGVHGGALAQLAPVATIGPEAPVVTAASSQYFQRTFNRLVVPPVIAPVAPPPIQPVFHVGPPPTVFVEPTNTPVAVNPPPTQEAPVQPNIAIAVATAHAAAPVATILLPPYPFGFPPNIGFIPQEQAFNVPDENTKEPTTQSTTQAEVTTTQEPEPTTPIPESSDNNFVQALPSNENVNFKLYGAPSPPPNSQFQPNQHRTQFQPNQPRPQFQPNQFQPNQPRPQFQPQQPRPQIQPLPPHPQFPLQQSQPQFPQHQAQPQYPPLQPQPQQPRPQFQLPQQPQQPRPQVKQQNPHPVYQAPQQQWPQQKAKPQKLKTSVEVVPVPLAYITPPPLHKSHAHVKIVKHVYSFVPATSARIILRPVKVRPVRLVKVKSIHPQNRRANVRDIEVTTINPFPRPNTKPPKV